jgi:chemotaxis protein methyltransferase CheR
MPPDSRDAPGGGRDVPPVRRPIGSAPVAPTPAAPTLPLAQGDLSPRDAAELLALKAQIQSRVNFECAGYKEKCLRRRIAVRMRARGVHTYLEYSRILGTDASEYDRLVDTLTINVSKFYRNPEVWDLLREQVLPELFALDTPLVQVWSAGSASGEEPYTMSMIVREHADAHGGDADRFRILGTDIDRESLAYAQRAEYTDFAMSDIDPAMRDRWFDHDGIYRLRPAARRNVRFARLDLIRDVIIYFERSVQEELFRKFHEALVPGGYLVLGKVEALFGASAGLFKTVANRHRVFRRT